MIPVAVGAVLAGAPVVWAPVAGADTPVCSATSCTFVSPTRSISCVITVGNTTRGPDSALCSWADADRAQSVRLLPNGVLEPCINPAVTLIDRCKTDPAAASVPALGYGQAAVLGPFTCLAEAQSISCTAAPSGRGFSINSTGILPVLPPPPPPAPETPAPGAPPPPAPDAATAPVPDAPVVPPGAAEVPDQPAGQ